MASFASMPLFTDAITADCCHLTDAEFGLYTRILILLWRSPGCKIPNDDTWISHKLQRAPELFRPLINEFCDSTGNFIFQKRLMKEWEYTKEKSLKNSGSAKSRWNKKNDPCERNAPTPTPTQEKIKEGHKGAFEKIYNFGCELYPNLATQTTHAISMWISSGMDVELDILPAIKRVHKKGIKARGWGLFTQDIADDHEKRLKPMPKGNIYENTSGNTSSNPKQNKTQRVYDAARRAAEAGGYGFASRPESETTTDSDDKPIILDA